MFLPIKGYLKTSLIEWPGKISAVIFLPGCNFRCSFCHNSDLVLNPNSLESTNVDEVISDLTERKNWIDGVAVTGGEPTLQPGLLDFFRAVKEIGVATMLETNGTNPGILYTMFQENLLDHLSMDLKGPFDERYSKITGVSVLLDKIRESMTLIHESGISYEFRTTVVPGVHTTADILDLAASIPWAKRWYLQQFVPHNTINPELTSSTPYAKKIMEKLERDARKYVKTVRLRGM